MRKKNTITLNGTNSSEIVGLIIQALPPISKPPVRTLVEEIDGRDGDVVTALGYGAYQKEITIGLFGNFDIDAVIEYFNSEGTVTFSNEPDKVYNYAIYEQIDFDRLVRYRTATVTFHVQPFKFSTDELPKTFNIDPNLITIPDFTKTTNGITLTAAGDTISIEGTGTAATEFYLPVSGLNLAPGSYTMTATASGRGATACSVRLIENAPSNAETFGGNYITLKNDAVTISDTLTETTTYNYLWFYITAGTELDFTATVTVENDAPPSITIRNNGNIYAKPTMTLTGTGTINLSLNGAQLFEIYLPEQLTTITIDTLAMEAYQETLDNLMNRYVDGDYDNFKLNPGANIITWTGDLTSITMEDYSRWI